MFALIRGNKVIQVNLKRFPIAKPLVWIECDSYVKADYHFINDEFKDDIRPSSQKKEDLRKELIDVRLTYLKSTDYRVLRFVDEGTPYPDQVKAKRILARKEINDITTTISLTILKEFSVTFE